MRLSEDGERYLNLYELEVKCPSCGRATTIYEIPVNQFVYDDHECEHCDAQIQFEVEVSVIASGKVKEPVDL